MIDLGLNQYKIKEIKYEVKEGKTVIFKLNNFYLEDVDIIDESNCSEPKESENSVSENGEINAKKFGKEILEYLDKYEPIDESIYKEPKESENSISENGEINAKKLGKEILEYIKERTPSKNEHPFSRKPKELHDYDPVSCLEHGLRQTLEASRKKEWIDDVKENPSKPTQTGNALIPVDNSSPLKENESKKDLCATAQERAIFMRKQKEIDNRLRNEFIEKEDKKLVKSLVKSKQIIDEYVNNMPEDEKEKFENRIKNKFLKKDDNDDFSKIRSLRCKSYADGEKIIMKDIEKELKAKVYDETISQLEKDKENEQ